MSVLACDRVGCENIMCDRIIDGRYYICDDCHGELIVCKDGWPSVLPRREILDRIDAFMRTRPGSYLTPEEGSVDAILERLIVKRDS